MYFGGDGLFLRGGEPPFVFSRSFCFLGLFVYFLYTLLFCGNISMFFIYKKKVLWSTSCTQDGSHALKNVIQFSYNGPYMCTNMP